MLRPQNAHHFTKVLLKDHESHAIDLFEMQPKMTDARTRWRTLELLERLDLLACPGQHAEDVEANLAGSISVNTVDRYGK
jgi:hypothetical protein